VRSEIKSLLILLAGIRGFNLFVVSGLTGESILKIARQAVPFVLSMLVIALFIAFVPELTTVLLPDAYK